MGKTATSDLKTSRDFPPVKTEFKGNTHASKQMPKNVPSSTSTLPSPPIISSNNKTMHDTSNYSTVILLPATDIARSQSFVTDNKNEAKLKAIQELSFASNTSIFHLPLMKNKLV